MIEGFNAFKVFIISVVIDQALHHLSTFVVADSLIQQVASHKRDFLGVGIIIEYGKGHKRSRRMRIHFIILQICHKKMRRALKLGNQIEEPVVSEDGLDKEWATPRTVDNFLPFFSVNGNTKHPILRKHGKWK